MCNCNSQWEQNARNFLRNNRNSQDAKYLVVQYLINNNKCGRNNGVYLSELLNHLDKNGYNFSRENFQHNVLIPLKQNNILISLPYPGRKGGIFIPCSIDEIKKAYRQILKRVQSELNNISSLANGANITKNLNNILQLLQQEINNL